MAPCALYGSLASGPGTARWDELVAAGLLNGNPDAPAVSGGHFTLGYSTCNNIQTA